MQLNNKIKAPGATMPKKRRAWSIFVLHLIVSVEICTAHNTVQTPMKNADNAKWNNIHVDAILVENEVSRGFAMTTMTRELPTMQQKAMRIPILKKM